VLSFVGQEEDGLDVISMLEHYKKGWSSKIKVLQLQKFANGVEVAVGAFFNGADYNLRVFITSSTEDVQRRHRPADGRDGDLAASGRARTSCSRTPWSERGATRRRRRHRLRRTSNCIVNSRGIYPLRIHAAGSATRRSIFRSKGPSRSGASFLPALARGEPFNLRTKRGFQIWVLR